MSNFIKLNEAINIDLDKLIDTRLLVQANSGGGKSWLLRRLLEQSHGKVQQIVIDLEGEFSTLREKYDYILAGKGGDTPADPRSAGLLARKILELNVSAIIDLYELDHFERKRFVKLFIDSLVNAPKELWHPALVVIDEAHVFCPEKGQSEAMNSVIDLATRGRKRGYCAILATQRLSKLHKDAAAECNNKLIGRTGLDVDMKRASEELGFTTKDQYLSLRNLGAGEFFAFGPAISTQVARIKVGEVETSHPKAGSRILTAGVTPPTEKIRKVLAKLDDLPKEAEEEAKTVDDLKKQVRDLKTKLTIAQRQSPQVSQKEIDEMVNKFVNKAREIERKQYEIELNKQREELAQRFMMQLGEIEDTNDRLFTKIRGDIASIPFEKEKALIPSKSVELKVADLPPLVQSAVLEKPVSSTPEYTSTENGNGINLCAKKIYSFLYANPDREFSKVQLGGVTGYSPNSGGFNNSLARLNSLGLIKRNGSISLGEVDPSLVLQGSQEEYSPEIWLQKLPKAPREVYQYLWNNPHEEVSKERIGEITGYSPTSGGFNNALAKLNALGLIKRLSGGMIRLNEELLNL